MQAHKNKISRIHIEEKAAQEKISVIKIQSTEGALTPIHTQEE